VLDATRSPYLVDLSGVNSEQLVQKMLHGFQLKIYLLDANKEKKSHYQIQKIMKKLIMIILDLCTV